MTVDTPTLRARLEQELREIRGHLCNVEQDYPSTADAIEKCVERIAALLREAEPPHATTECCGVPIAADQRFCSKCGYEARAAASLAPPQEEEQMKDEHVCEHGMAMDVHCCNCHSGFLFDVNSCVCQFEREEPMQSQETGDIFMGDLEAQKLPGNKELPRYQSHKQVWALKIAEVKRGQLSDGSGEIVPVDEGYRSFRVDRAYMLKHDPQPGGYYVLYADGYKSFSPAEAFEGGYTRISA